METPETPKYSPLAAGYKTYSLIEAGFMSEFPYAIIADGFDRWLCGYLGLPTAHPLAKLDPDTLDNMFNINFDRVLTDYPIETMMPVRWLGFDTYHVEYLVNKTQLDPKVVREKLGTMAEVASEYTRTQLHGRGLDEGGGGGSIG